jgi:5-methylcytosine-specific restriction endonuclease McrA
MVKGKATVLKFAQDVIRTGEQVIQIPLVMKLIKIIRTIYRSKVPFSKKNIMIRDNFVCQYCGSTEELTIDHVMPISRGGVSCFENCVTACKKCNTKKANKSCAEAQTFIRKTPIAPTIAEFTRLKAQKSLVFDLLKELGIY